MSRPRLIEVHLGDQPLLAEVTVTGRYHRATYDDPEEYPEVEVLRLMTPGKSVSLTGLLEFEPVREAVQAQCDQAVADEPDEGPDPDEAYERSREERRP